MSNSKLCTFAVLALLSGCSAGDGPKTAGGDGARAAAPAVAAPESRFVAEAEAICKDANRKETAAGATGIDWIRSDLFTDPDFLERFTAVGRSALVDLRKLAPPPEDEKRFETALAAIDTMLRALEKHMAGLRAGEGGGDTLASYERGYTDLVAAGGPLGFTECLDVVL